MCEKMTRQEIDQWNELYEYVKHDILQYEKDMKLSKDLILRLKGLHEGKFMANKSTKPLANYSFKTIMITFQLNKTDIIRAISDKNKFKNEAHMINYLMVIIEKNINDTYLRMKRVELSKEKGEGIEINICDDKAEYVKKTKEIKNTRIKNLR